MSKDAGFSIAIAPSRGHTAALYTNLHLFVQQSIDQVQYCQLMSNCKYNSHC